jgi:[glutamine synthetase] adenylyltransferase / [glutamine synthetase]-adenylyl-L-tyrosine phosphorylase
VQFLVLAHAATYPGLTANSGNLALLKQAALLGLIDEKSSSEVREIYRALRRLQHKMRLNNAASARIAQNEINVAPVLALWKILLQE